LQVIVIMVRESTRETKQVLRCVAPFSGAGSVVRYRLDPRGHGGIPSILS
jgi:hypothetical protein